MLKQEKQCGATTQSLASINTQTFELNKITSAAPCWQIRFGSRSVDGVIFYLGEYLRHVDTVNPRETACQTSEICIGSSDPLFRLEEKSGIRQSFWSRDPSELHASYGSNDYRIPTISGLSHRSMQMVSLIQQLTNLHKKKSDQPTPTFIQVN
ncbi:MAG: hypothetical protein GKR90_08615 [Pseudomonadales bacterium]|nr:hypothetical protein [Pseudomonadales bacterium]